MCLRFSPSPTILTLKLKGTHRQLEVHFASGTKTGVSASVLHSYLQSQLLWSETHPPRWSCWLPHHLFCGIIVKLSQSSENLSHSRE